ncbi:MAG: hypothetical protein ACRCZS_08760 [Chroococcidiopsis sp.]
MATRSFTAFASNETDAAFRSWVQGLSDALTFVGIPKTNDTGQFDPTTITRPTTVSTYSGYEIRKFNDPLQASAPVFIKYEVGTSGSLNAQAIRLTIGVATDGAGNIIGNQSLPKVFGHVGTVATGQHTHLVSGSNNRFAVTLASTTNSSLYFAVERSRDNSGNPTANQIIITGHQSTGGRYAKRIPFTGGVPADDFFCNIGASGNTGVNKGKAFTAPIYPNENGELLNPGLNQICYYTTDVPVGTVDVVSMYGINRIYQYLGANLSHSGTIRGANIAWNAATTLAMLWE